MITLDIETIPDPRLPVVDPTKMDPDGRLKDPEKMKQSQMDKAIKAQRARALSASSCAVVCISASVDFGKVVSFDSNNEAWLLKEFWSWLCAQDEPAPEESVHTLVAHNGLGFDFPVLSWRAVVHGVHGLARRFRVRHKYNPGPGMADTALLTKGRCCEVAASLGHTHPSPDGGSKVFEWEAMQLRHLTISHCEDDVEALNVIVKSCLDAGLIVPQR